MSINYEPNSSLIVDKRMYVLINRKDLTIVQCGVQAAHAIHEYALNYSDDVYLDWAKNHKTLIFLEASLEEISKMCEYFERNGKKYCKFHEPDLNGLLTAVAFEPLLSEDGKVIFNQFKLLK